APERLRAPRRRSLHSAVWRPEDSLHVGAHPARYGAALGPPLTFYSYGQRRTYAWLAFEYAKQRRSCFLIFSFGVSAAESRPLLITRRPTARNSRRFSNESKRKSHWVRSSTTNISQTAPKPMSLRGKQSSGALAKHTTRP